MTSEIAQLEVAAANEHLGIDVFHHVTTEGSDTCKGDQLNYVISHCWEQLDLPPMDDSLYIGVYDADSLPDVRVLKYIAHDAVRYQREKGSFPPAYQQVPIYVQNLDRLPKGIEGIILRTRPVDNAVFTFSVEIPLMARQVDILERPASTILGKLLHALSSWLTHAIGHGEFFRADLLHRLGGFQAPSCDTSFGYMIAFSARTIRPVPLIDVCQTPSSIKTLVKQGAVWYNGVNLFLRDWRFAQTIGQACRPWPHILVMFARRVGSNLTWAILPIFWWSWLVLDGLTDQNLMSLLLAFGMVIYMLPAAVILLQYDSIASLCQSFTPIPSLSKGRRMLMFLIYPFELLVGALGPIYYYYMSFLASIGRGEVRLEKTAR